jgi:hypothetical protein
LSQLDNIALIIEELLRLRLIKEIGMPLDYSHKFVNLVLFIKPVDAKSSMSKIEIYVILIKHFFVNNFQKNEKS